MNKGSVSIQAVLSGAAILMGMTGGVFAWTYSQLSSHEAHAAQTDSTVAAVVQKTDDMDSRLIRVENKEDLILQNQQQLYKTK